MNYILFFIWPLIFLSYEQVSYRGLLQAANKQALAKDLVHILKTLVQNAKFWDYPDVKEEQGEGAFHRGLYMTDIDIKSIDFDENSLAKTISCSPSEKKIMVKSKEPILKYIFHFKWRIEAFGVHIGYGEGNATMTSNDISAYYSIPQKGEVSTKFDVKIVSLKGVNALCKGIEKWLNKCLNTNTYPHLLKAISGNEKFITEYMHYQFKRIDRRVKEDTLISYISTPYDLAEVDNFIAYSFNTSLYIDGKLIEDITQTQTIKNESIADKANDYRIFHSPRLIPISLRVYGNLKIFDQEIDPKSVGLTGTIADLLEAIPELETKYARDTKIRITCEYPSEPKNFNEVTDSGIEFTVNCKFAVSNTKECLLDASGVLSMTYQSAVSDDQSKLYVSFFDNCKLVSQSSKPSSPDIGAFVSPFFNAYGQSMWQAKRLNIPRLRYETLRDYANFNASIVEGSYVADYLDKK